MKTLKYEHIKSTFDLNYTPLESYIKLEGHNYSRDYLTFEALEDCVFTFTMNANLPTTCVADISYSLDKGKTWTTVENVNSQEVVVTTPTVEAGNKVLWKGHAVLYAYARSSTAEAPNANWGLGYFRSTGEHNISGNIMSLLYGDKFIGKVEFKTYYDTRYAAGAFTHIFSWNYDYSEYSAAPNSFNEKIISTKNLILPATTLAPYCYYGMFMACNGMVDCPQLPAMNLARACYKDMFYLCGALLEPPVLPATTLATECYQEMLDRCRSMLYAPELPATTLAPYCYYGMFSCDTFTEAPALPATTLANNCYHAMFYLNTGITKAPDLPATELASECYHAMFNKCSALTTAPEILPATTLAANCYEQMFMNCTNLETTPELPAISLTTSCYKQMFLACPKVNHIKAMFTTAITSDTTSPTRNWVNGVSSTGTFIKNSEATWDLRGTSGIPTNWTVTVE